MVSKRLGSEYYFAATVANLIGMLSTLVSLVFSTVLLKGVLSLRDVRLLVPEAVKLGQSATLSCHFQLEDDSLYTVKWYKYQDEFYRYTPKEKPPLKVFAVNDISDNVIEKSQSNGTQLTFKKMSYEMSGLYSCEVSADAPSFQTATVSANVVVIEPPKTKPVISGFKSKYKGGEVVNVNCTSPGSIPAPNITWAINGRVPESKHVSERRRTLNDDQEQTISTIRFHARPHHFHDGRLRLKCAARIYTVYWETAEQMAALDEKSGQNLPSYGGRNGNELGYGWRSSSKDSTEPGRHTPLPPTESLSTGEGSDVLEEAPISSNVYRHNPSILFLILVASTASVLSISNQQ